MRAGHRNPGAPNSASVVGTHGHAQGIDDGDCLRDAEPHAELVQQPSLSEPPPPCSHGPERPTEIMRNAVYRLTGALDQDRIVVFGPTGRVLHC